MARLAEAAEQKFWAGVRGTSDFFMQRANVHAALQKLAKVLESQSIPYAIVDAMALNEFGYGRATADVDVLLTADGLAAFKSANLGRGYVEKFPGSRGVRDTENNVEIDVVLTGAYPGDGKPKPVAFPDPATVAERGASVALLPLPHLITLKLASGMSAPHRLKDLADVQELIRLLRLPETFAAELDPYVRGKFIELWTALAVAEPPEE